jgi:hypothetical protein
MKLIGSITKDFPFIDESTRYEIESVMDEAKNYGDFAEKSSRRAANPDCNPLIVFLSLYHLSRVENSIAIESVDRN